MRINAVTTKIKRAGKQKASGPRVEDERCKTNRLAYWFVVVVELVAGGVAGGEVMSYSCLAQPMSTVETAAIKNNSFFIRIP